MNRNGGNMQKSNAKKVAMDWSARVDLPCYVYKKSNGWYVAMDRIIANSRSAIVETVDWRGKRTY